VLPGPPLLCPVAVFIFGVFVRVGGLEFCRPAIFPIRGEPFCPFLRLWLARFFNDPPPREGNCLLCFTLFFFPLPAPRDFSRARTFSPPGRDVSVPRPPDLPPLHLRFSVRRRSRRGIATTPYLADVPSFFSTPNSDLSLFFSVGTQGLVVWPKHTILSSFSTLFDVTRSPFGYPPSFRSIAAASFPLVLRPPLILFPMKFPCLLSISCLLRHCGFWSTF